MNTMKHEPSSSVGRKYDPLIFSSDDSNDDEFLVKSSSNVNKCLFRSPIKESRVIPESTHKEESSSDSSDFRTVRKKKAVLPIRSSTDSSNTDGESVQTSNYRQIAKNATEVETAELICSDELTLLNEDAKFKRTGNLTNSKKSNQGNDEHEANMLELGNLLKNSSLISDIEVAKKVKKPPDDDGCYFTPRKLPILNSCESTGGVEKKDINSHVPKSSSNKKMGKTTPYSFSGRKLRPVLLVSDDETSSDDDYPVTPTVSKSNKQDNYYGLSASKLSFLKSLSPTVPEIRANPRALQFRKNFAKTKEQLSYHLYNLFNEKIFSNKLPTDMTLEWSNCLTSTAGYCRTQRHGDGSITCKICLSVKVLTTPDRLRDTLLHEMCHAAVRLISRLKEVHGPMWKTWALRCAIAFPEVKVPTRCHNYNLAFKYSYKCTSCEKIYGRHKQSIDVSRHRCGKCRGVLQQVSCRS